MEREKGRERIRGCIELRFRRILKDILVIEKF